MLRSTYHVFDLYVNELGDTVVDLWEKDAVPEMTVPHKQGGTRTVKTLDLLATGMSDREGLAIAAVNRHPSEAQEVTFETGRKGKAVILRLNGDSKDAYNDVGRTRVKVEKEEAGFSEGIISVRLDPHSVNVIRIEKE